MNLTMAYLLFILAAAFDRQSNPHEIYAKIKNGDQQAFKSFFDSHHKKLFYFLTGKGISPQEAEDLIQQAFVYIWENRHTINEYKSLKAYLFQIAYSRMLNLIRDNKKFDDNEEISELEQNSENPASDIENEELKTIMEQAISAMPEKRQHVFRLCFLQEFTYKEAAEFLEVSVKTVENHMGMALKDLRSALSEIAEDYLN
jgi:RNA polymerase sigma-70 factor (ECF subfamily)